MPATWQTRPEAERLHALSLTQLRERESASAVQTICTIVWKVSCPIHCCFHCWRKPGLTVLSQRKSQRTTDRSPTYRPCPRSLRDLCWQLGTPMSPPAQLCQLQPIPVCIQEGTFHGDCTTGSPGQCLHGGRWQGSHCPDRPWPVGGLWHRWTSAPSRLPVAWVWSVGDTTQLAAVLSRRPDPIRPFLYVYNLEENLLFFSLILGSVFNDHVVFYGDVLKCAQLKILAFTRRYRNF